MSNRIETNAPLFEVDQRVFVNEVWGRPVQQWGVIQYIHGTTTYFDGECTTTWTYHINLDGRGREQVVEANIRP